MRTAPLSWVLLGLLVASGPGCSTTRQPQVVAKATPRLHQGPLTDYVPAAGLRWLVVVEPKTLHENPEIAAAVQRFLPKERMDAFAAMSGVELTTLESAVIAGFDLGTLYLVRTSERIGIAHQAFMDRLVQSPVTKRLGEGVTHTTGVIGLTPESFVALEGIGFGLSVGDPTLTKISGAYALGKLAHSPPALRGAALKQLPTALPGYPLEFYVPGPFTGSWARGAEGLLADTVALAVVARPESSGVLRVVATAVGDYGQDAPEANRKARQLLTELATSNVGRLLGLNDDAVTSEVVADSTQIGLSMTLPLSRLLDGLYAATAANVSEMLSGGRTAP